MQHRPKGGAMIIERMQPHTHAGILHSPGRRIDPSDGAARAVEPEKPTRKE